MFYVMLAGIMADFNWKGLVKLPRVVEEVDIGFPIAVDTASNLSVPKSGADGRPPPPDETSTSIHDVLTESPFSRLRYSFPWPWQTCL